MKILIGDDHELISAGIIAKFKSIGRHDEFKTAKNKSELINLLRNESFEVIILDVRFGKDDAREIIREFQPLDIKLRWIALSSHEDEMTVKSVLASGFHSYVSKHAAIEELIEAVNKVSKNEQYVSKDLEKKLFTALFSSNKNALDVKMTNREKEILQLIQNGLSTKEMASKLFLSEKTIETYRSNLLLKFKVKNVASLVRESILQGYTF